MNDSDRKLFYELEDLISLGYQWIEKIEEEYRNPPDNGISAILSKYYRLVSEWEEQVKQKLPNNSRRLQFSLARSTDPTYEANKNADIQNLVKSIRARIVVLEDYRRELQTPSVNLGPQARLNINSTDNSTNVIADQLSVAVNQLEAEFEQNYQGTDREELLGLIKELKGNQSGGKRAREILGTILTRGAELAQIGSLAAQILAMLPK